MHRLIQPILSGVESFDAAVSSIQCPADRQPYMAVSSAVATCCANFDRLASSANFHAASSAGLSLGETDGDAMVKLYERQFVRNKGTQTIRDAIKNAAPNGLCPYCGQGSVYELDHYLPKRPFTGTAVHPANLVPACRDCNRIKSQYYPSSTKPAVLHPYFDTAFDIRWLYASVVQLPNGKPTIEFSVQLATNDLTLQDRLESHMRVFDLYERFRVRGAQALSNFEGLLRSPMVNSVNLDWAKEHLVITAFQQAGGRVNSWEFAVHEAMAQDEWYLEFYLKL